MDYLIEQGIKVDAIITDPPYGTTACSWDNVIPFDKMWDRLKLLRKDTTPIVLFGSEPFSTHLRMSNIKEFKYDWIWYKNLRTGFANAEYMPMKSYELISLFYLKKPTYNPIKVKRTTTKSGTKKTNFGDVYGNLKNNNKPNNQTDFVNPHNVINFIKAIHGTQKRSHPTQKPIELMEYLIKTYTNKGDLILDFTSGSFTTCVGAEQLNRRSIGIELEKKYCDVGVKRLSQLQLRLDI
jgi:site-specific DNA-methyltransferase (adenine-specific)